MPKSTRFRVVEESLQFEMDWPPINRSQTLADLTKMEFDAGVENKGHEKKKTELDEHDIRKHFIDIKVPADRIDVSF